MKADAQYLHISVQSGTTQGCSHTSCWLMTLRNPEPVLRFRNNASYC
ncbi:Uncharacterised protein [Vibrio cholerae]|nr:Uncharacterised protein [Vibrio cholerae]